jgi:hypothetical protein
MKHRKHGLSFGLLAVVVLGMMAFASSAQAIPLQSGFFIKGAQVGALKASVGGTQIGRGTLLVPALKVEVNCEKFSILSGFVNTTTDGEGQLLYEECTVLTNEVKEGKTILIEAPGCEIVVNHEAGAQKHHVTATALLLPAELTDGSPAILAEKILAKVLTKPEVGCILPKTTEIKGELCLKVENNHTVTPTVTASQAIQESCRPRTALESLEEKTAAEGGIKDKLLFGINESFVDGKASVFLNGEVHKGLTLGVLLI